MRGHYHRYQADVDHGSPRAAVSCMKQRFTWNRIAQWGVMLLGAFTLKLYYVLEGADQHISPPWVSAYFASDYKHSTSTRRQTPRRDVMTLARRFNVVSTPGKRWRPGLVAVATAEISSPPAPGWFLEEVSGLIY